MSITDDELRMLEELARVSLRGKARVRLGRQLGRIIEFVRKLESMDTAEWTAEPRTRTAGSRLRDDTVLPCLEREEILAEAPDPLGPFFRVPPFMESEE